MNATSPIAAAAALAGRGEHEAHVPRLGDPDVRWIFAATFLLQAFAWWWLEGYPLADAVGYLDRSREFVTNGALQPTAENLRSVAFPLLFAPLFELAQRFEIEDTRWIMPCARLMQMAMAAGLVHGCIRLGARLFGRDAGLVAGYLAATSPVLIVHSVSPVADVAAGLCVVRAAEALLFGQSRRRVAVGGLWAGLGFVISYKTLAVQLLIGLLLLVRDRWRRRRTWVALALGVSAFCALQVGVDKLVYGRAGHSVFNYLADNVLGVFARALLGVGLLEPGKAVYRWMSELREYQLDEAVHWDLVTPANQMGAWWYVSHAYEIVVPVIAVLLPFGLARIVREARSERATWARRLDAWIPILIVVGYVYLLSQKGNKSLRLLLPVLPFLVVTAAAGWSGLCDWVALRWGARGPVHLARVGLFVALVTAVVGYHASGPRAYGGYWQGMDWINARTADQRASGEVARVASAHYFAVFLRAAPGVEQVRYRYPVWEWNEGETSPAAAQINRHIGRTLDAADWLVHAEALMVRRPTYLRALQNRFDVAAAFWDRGFHSEKVGPVYVLQRRPADQEAVTGHQFFVVRRKVDVEDYCVEQGLETPLVFARTDAAGRRRELTLLGVEADPLAGTGMTWLTFHWTTSTGLELDWDFATHLTTADGHEFDLGHRPAYGVLPTSEWRPGWVIREGLLARTTGPPLIAQPPRASGRPPYRMTLEILVRDASGQPSARLTPEGNPAGGPTNVADLIRR